MKKTRFTSKHKWYYGVIRKTRRVKDKTYHYYGIHEIYESSNGFSWSSDPIMPSGDSVKELISILGRMVADAAFFPVYEIRKGKLIKRKSG